MTCGRRPVFPTRQCKERRHRIRGSARHDPHSVEPHAAHNELAARIEGSWRHRQLAATMSGNFTLARPGIAPSRRVKRRLDALQYAELSGFDDSAWPEVTATDLGATRGGDMVSFLWFRATLTVPPKVMDFDTAGVDPGWGLPRALSGDRPKRRFAPGNDSDPAMTANKS